MKPFVDSIPPLLEEGIRVLIYAGDAGISFSSFMTRLYLQLDWQQGLVC